MSLLPIIPSFFVPLHLLLSINQCIRNLLPFHLTSVGARHPFNSIILGVFYSLSIASSYRTLCSCSISGCSNVLHSILLQSLVLMLPCRNFIFLILLVYPFMLSLLKTYLLNIYLIYLNKVEHTDKITVLQCCHAQYKVELCHNKKNGS